MAEITNLLMKDKLFAEDLRNVCINIKNCILNNEKLTEEYNVELMKILNNLFDDMVCTNVLFTNNTDKAFFAILVDPTIMDTDIAKIVLGTEDVQLNRYAVEIDTRIFNYVDATAVCCYLVEEIATIMNPVTINNVRGVLDVILANTEDHIEIKSSIYYSQLLTFGIKDTIQKVGSLLYKNKGAVGNNIYSKAFKIEDILLDTLEKLRTCIFGDHDVSVAPKMGILQWVLNTYREINLNYSAMEDILKTARLETGSILLQKEVDRTIKSLRRATSEVISESAPLMEAFKFSLFKNLKQNGLRSIEDDLYEYKIRIKNCEDQDEAMYILRQINTRINILEDYIYNTSDISENEANRWRNVIMMFRELRTELGKKKLGNKSTYGIFVDYNKIDQLDNESPAAYY